MANSRAAKEPALVWGVIYRSHLAIWCRVVMMPAQWLIQLLQAVVDGLASQVESPREVCILLPLRGLNGCHDILVIPRRGPSLVSYPLQTAQCLFGPPNPRVSTVFVSVICLQRGTNLL